MIKQQTEEFRQFVKQYNTGLTQEQSHERAQQRRRDLIEEKERDGLSYAELGKRHGITATRAWQLCRSLDREQEEV